MWQEVERERMVLNWWEVCFKNNCEVRFIGGGLSKVVGDVRLVHKTGGDEVETPATHSFNVFLGLHRVMLE